MPAPRQAFWAALGTWALCTSGGGVLLETRCTQCLPMRRDKEEGQLVTSLLQRHSSLIKNIPSFPLSGEPHKQKEHTATRKESSGKPILQAAFSLLWKCALSASTTSYSQFESYPLSYTFSPCIEHANVALDPV